MKTAMELPNVHPMVFAGDRSCMGMEDALAREEDPVATESGSALLSAAVECKGIRATSDFPRDLSGLSEEQIAHAYSAMRNSHASLSRARGQLQRRSRELREARDRFLATLHGYEERLVVIGKEKAEALSMAQELHRELELFEGKQQALDRLLTDLDEAKEQAGFWSILRITELIGKMRSLLRGGAASDG
jgi:prefoldin subunit 5